MSLKIVFLGTPDFAVSVLATVNASKHEVVGVVTNIDKPAGRGKRIHESAVKKYALENKLSLLQPEKLKGDDFIQSLKALKADVFIVVAFRMLPKEVWSIPPKGTFNLHASLLPNYRGAAPINWAVINQETKTGLTTFMIDEKIDTGNLLLQTTVSIDQRETAGSLHDSLATLGGDLVVQTLDKIAHGITPTPQKTNGSEKEAPKLNKLNTRINWSNSLDEIDALIRGLSPYPVAWTEFVQEEKILPMKIYASEIELTQHNFSLNQLVVEGKQLKVAHTKGFLCIKEVQLPNKKRMLATDLLNGFQFSADAVVK
ncbi:MAG: methionyl-tRNA formyltransferase [Flavobacteriaceae bacterium]|nr:methionyl-tRNA formyltransferase [Flavobacteriaceae bacterium]